MVRWLVCYDIPNDQIRQRVADFCLDKGLERVQYSVFLGKMDSTLAYELAAQVRQKLGRNEGQVRFIPVCAKDWDRAFKVQVGVHLGTRPREES